MSEQIDVEEHRKTIPSSLNELRYYLIACCMRPQPGCSLSWTQPKGPKPFIQNIIYQNIAVPGFQYAILLLAQRELQRRVKRGRGHALDSSNSIDLCHLEKSAGADDCLSGRLLHC